MARGRRSEHAEEKRGETGRGRGLGGLVSSVFLVATGVAVGLVIGTVWPTPGVIRDWLTGPVERVVLGRPSRELAAEPPPARLDEFRGLQTGRRGPTRSVPRPEPLPDVSAAPPPAARPQERGSAERVIADLAEQTRTILPSVDSAPPEAPKADADRRVAQVASYVERPPADALARRLAGLGFDAYVTDARPGGETRYRVRVRPASGQRADELSALLESRGYSVWVTRE